MKVSTAREGVALVLVVALLALPIVGSAQSALPGSFDASLWSYEPVEHEAAGYQPPTLHLVRVELRVRDFAGGAIRMRQNVREGTPRYEPWFVRGWQDVCEADCMVTVPAGPYMFGIQTRSTGLKRRQWDYTTHFDDIDESGIYELRSVSRSAERHTFAILGSLGMVIGATLLGVTLARSNQGNDEDGLTTFGRALVSVAILGGGTFAAFGPPFMIDDYVELVRLEDP